MLLERILVGMDFSAPAIAAARWAATQFAPGAELVLVHVVDVASPPVFARGVLPDVDATREVAHEFAETRLRELVARLAPARVRWSIRDGRPAQRLAEAATELEADAILVGPHGDRPRPRKMLGTTAERLVRGAGVSVIVACGERLVRPRRILAAVDDSPISHSVLWWTNDLARAFGAEVVAFSVVDEAALAHTASTVLAATADPGTVSDELEREMRDEGVRWLQRLGAPAVSPAHFSASVTVGKPGDAILATADERDVDLIVMGHHGHGALLPALLGSTLGVVLHGARCPVFVAAPLEDAVVQERD